jgi:hypothetical protein
MVNEYYAECDGSDNQIFLWIDPLADCALRPCRHRKPRLQNSLELAQKWDVTTGAPMSFS